MVNFVFLYCAFFLAMLGIAFFLKKQRVAVYDYVHPYRKLCWQWAKKWHRYAYWASFILMALGPALCSLIIFGWAGLVHLLIMLSVGVLWTLLIWRIYFYSFKK